MRPRPLPAGEAKKEARMISTLGSLLIGTILPFLVVLTVVVFVHELGHFLVARGVGVAVKTFSLGFGPELFGRDDAKGTRWRLSAVPLGGLPRLVPKCFLESLLGQSKEDRIGDWARAASEVEGETWLP